MSVEKAKVIPLHGDSSRSGARAGAGRKASPGVPTQAVDEDLDAVIRQIGGQRSADADADDLITRIAGLADFLRKRLTGDYAVDEFGFDPEYNDAVVLPTLRFFYDKWFRVEVSGIENLPSTGAGLVVANHAGTVPFDEVNNQITSYLKSTRQREAVQKVMKDLKDSAKIQTFLPAVEPAAPAPAAASQPASN